MSQVEDVCGENGYRCEECTVCARTQPCECGCGLLGGTCGENNSCINCGEQLEEFDMEKCCCCEEEEKRVCDEDEAIAEDLETIGELKMSGKMEDIDEAIDLLKRLMLHFSYRTERHGIIDIAESYLMNELVELKNKI